MCSINKIGSKQNKNHCVNKTKQKTTTTIFLYTIAKSVHITVNKYNITVFSMTSVFKGCQCYHKLALNHMCQTADFLSVCGCMCQYPLVNGINVCKQTLFCFVFTAELYVKSSVFTLKDKYRQLYTTIIGVR